MDKHIFIEPLARVEGHGGIEVYIENDMVKEVKFEIFEGPRLFEQLVVGKDPQEAVAIASRICAICFVSHTLAEIRAIERALDVKVGRKIHLLRKLAHYGEMIESHSLHYYLLALPDYFGYPDAIAMIRQFPDEVIGGLELKKFGNKVMEIVAGRRIHGENLQVGGIGKIPTDEELEWIKLRAMELIPTIERGIQFWNEVDVPDYLEEETIFISVWPEDGTYDFRADTIYVSTGETYAADDYQTALNERVVPHSFAKRCRYKGKPYSVGALARILNMRDRLDGLAADYFKKLYNERWHKNPHFNNIAQAIEILYCLEHIPKLVDEIKATPLEESTRGRDTGAGTGLVEAPRGLLIHHTEMENGRVKYADYLVPTAQNLDDAEKYMRNAVKNLLKQGVQDLELPLEMIARAYDPCISCSVHLVKVIKK
ncbi:MAG: Ni/Fe hydrogenase subunit alpha [Candidatus Hydrothermota bacterium]|nr:MAG: Ni/Fe hydrogenase subunit alpha [Candidatus Hydrothermae bacterium]